MEDKVSGCGARVHLHAKSSMKGVILDILVPAKEFGVLAEFGDTSLFNCIWHDDGIPCCGGVSRNV